jgi:hypothetical protein
VSGTTPGPGSESAAPAAFSSPAPDASAADAPAAESILPESAGPPVTEASATEADTPPTSLLSEAKPEEPAKPDEPKKEEAPPDAEPKKEEPKPAEVVPPTYEAFTVPEGVTLDSERTAAFGSLLGEYEVKLGADPAANHAAMQEMGQKMVDLYVHEMQEQANRMARLQKDTWDRVTEEWLQEFRDDPEMGGRNQQKTVQRMGALLNQYGQNVGSDLEAKAREAFAVTGAGNNPHVLRLFNWMANRLVERPRPVPALVPRAPTVPTTRAQRMYRNSGNGAA